MKKHRKNDYKIQKRGTFTLKRANSVKNGTFGTFFPVLAKFGKFTENRYSVGALPIFFRKNGLSFFI